MREYGQRETYLAIFPGASSGPHVDDLKSRFDREAAAITDCMRGTSSHDIITRIEQFCAERKASFENLSLTESDIPTDAFLFYLHRRVRRQLGWFIDLTSGLEHAAERRKNTLLYLYILLSGMVLVQLAFFLSNGRSSPYLVFLLLLMVGISATMTAYYFSMSARSLIHRYKTQRLRVARWLNEVNVRWKFRDLPSLSVDLAAKHEMRARILQFEDIMSDELVDWIHTVSPDAMELTT